MSTELEESTDLDWALDLLARVAGPAGRDQYTIVRRMFHLFTALQEAAQAHPHYLERIPEIRVVSDPAFEPRFIVGEKILEFVCEDERWGYRESVAPTNWPPVERGPFVPKPDGVPLVDWTTAVAREFVARQVTGEATG